MPKNRTRLRGTNFCINRTSSAYIELSFVRRQNGPKGTKIVRNSPKHEFRVPWGGSGVFIAKNSDATSWHELFTRSARFPPSFVRQPNGPEGTQWYKMHQNINLGSNGVVGCIHCEKFRLDFVAQTFALDRPVFHRVL